MRAFAPQLSFEVVMQIFSLSAAYRATMQGTGRLWMFAILVCTMFLQTAWSQSNAVDGAVNGYVSDSTGAAVPSAAVTLVNQETNVSEAATSAKDGYFHYPLVPIGTYTLRVKAPGYQEYVRRGITVAVGSEVKLTPQLSVGAENATVDVNADASMLETATPAIGGVITQAEMENLPLTSRNIYNLFFFVPGAKGIPSDNFATPGYSFGGILRASWSTDGIDNSDRATTSPLRLVINTPGAVQQIQVLANGYQAEFGKSSGGQTNVITRSGTNSYHGSAMYLYRPKALAAIPSLSKSKTNLEWYMFEGNVGGPIVHDHLFFFANYEHNPYIQPNGSTITASTIAALGLSPLDTAELRSGQNYDSPSLRVDYKFSAKNSGFLRYNRFTNNSPYSGAGGLTVNSRTTHPLDDQNGGEVQLATIVTPTLLNELRFGVNRRETIGQPQFPATPMDVATNITGYANLGNSPETSNMIESLYQLVDNASWQHGKHMIKAGGDFQLTDYFTRAATSRTFTFGGLAAVKGGRGAVTALNQYLYTIQGQIDPSTSRPYTYTSLGVSLGDPSVTAHIRFLNAFVQDEYRISKRLSASVGLRYEKQLYPEGSSNSTYGPAHMQVHSRSLSFAPRAGIAWSPNEKTMLRAAGGLFFDVPNLTFFTNLLANDGNSYHSYTIAGNAAGAPVYPHLPDFVSSTFAARPDFYDFDPNFKSMYAVHANARLQQVITKDLMLTVSYMFFGTRFGPFLYDANLGSTGTYLADGRPVYTTTKRPNPNYGRIYQWTSQGTSNYNGLDVSIDKRLSHRLLFSANYSWSHALGDSDQNGYVVSDPSNVRRDYGNLSTDVRHYFIARGLYTTGTSLRWLRWSNGTGLSLMSLLTSGRPLDARAGADLNGDLATNDRPLFFSRNAFQGAAYLRVDARASKTFTIKDRFKVQAIFEGTNLMNHLNAACSVTGCNSAINGTYTSPTFGKITAASQSRTFQGGGRFSF